jgi:hypothetical protein
MLIFAEILQPSPKFIPARNELTMGICRPTLRGTHTNAGDLAWRKNHYRRSPQDYWF